jgi:hypothetical protein
LSLGINGFLLLLSMFFYNILNVRFGVVSGHSFLSLFIIRFTAEPPSAFHSACPERALLVLVWVVRRHASLFFPKILLG